MSLSLTVGVQVSFTYTNHRGITEERTIIPHRLYHGVSTFHPEPQWLLECYDMDRQAIRTYALSGIKTTSTLSTKETS